jgi:hypothetical protein
MESLELEQRIKDRQISGFEYPTGSPGYVGLVYIIKRPRGALTLEDPEAAPGTSHYEPLLRLSQEDPAEYAERLEELHDVLARPITVLVTEMDRKVWASPDDPEPKDYRRRDFHHFKSVPEVNEFLHTLGYSIADLLAIPRLE